MAEIEISFLLLVLGDHGEGVEIFHELMSPESLNLHSECAVIAVIKIFLIAEALPLAETSSLPSDLPRPTEPAEGWDWEEGRGPAGTRDPEVRRPQWTRKEMIFRPGRC